MRRSFTRFSLVLTVAGALVVHGCNCGTGTTPPGPGPGSDGGPDGGTPDAGSNCTGMPDDTACSIGVAEGFCVSGNCVACAGAADDPKCVAAYDAGHICVSGSCVAGNCHDSTTCSSGLVCANNNCSSCSSNAQCSADPVYGNGYACGSGGTCVPQICPANPTPPQAGCNGDAGTLCCAGTQGSDAGLCVTGNCCFDSDCGAGAPLCLNHVCTACPAVTDGHYFIDPVAGDDTVATGAGDGGAGCRFHSFTRAFQVIGAPASDVTVSVLPGLIASRLDGGFESFPVLVPGHANVVGSGVGAVTVKVPPNTVGFRITNQPTSFSGMLIDGSADAGATVAAAALLVQFDGGLTLSNVTVTNVFGNGIEVHGTTVGGHGGVLVIGAGVTAQNALGRHNGLAVVENGTAIINNPNGAQDSFSFNTSYGIAISGQGVLQLTADAGDPLTQPGVGTVVTNQNGTAGLYIGQEVAPATQSTVSGLVSWKNGTSGIGGATSAGIAIYSPSSVKIRNSVALGNVGDGVMVQPGPAGSVAPTLNLAQIDLGTGVNGSSADPGRNHLQSGVASLQNGGTGICLLALGAAATAGQTLRAEGNLFANVVDGGFADCSSADGGVLRSSNTCGQSDYGIATFSATTDVIDVNSCR